MNNYDARFFDYVNSGAIDSARLLLPHLLRILNVESVLDVGCGQGAWLSVWQELGVSDTIGIDGEYVDSSQLLIDRELFHSADLRNVFDLQRKFDLVQSLEVAEHLSEECAGDFISSLVQHGNIVLFSAAPPGQGGDHHVNEREYDYWRSLFAKHGFVAIDYLRPLVRNEQKIEPWYRYNTLLYVDHSLLSSLALVLKNSLVTENLLLKDISPFTYQLRKRVVRMLPVSIMTRIAKIKERFITLRRNN